MKTETLKDTPGAEFMKQIKFQFKKCDLKLKIKKKIIFFKSTVRYENAFNLSRKMVVVTATV